MNQALFNIGGCELAACEVRMFTDILGSDDHIYAPEISPDDLTKQTLDILVLEGILERFKGSDGDWLNVWGITQEALEWQADPDVQADIQLAKSINEMSGLLTSS